MLLVQLDLVTPVLLEESSPSPRPSPPRTGRIIWQLLERTSIWVKKGVLKKQRREAAIRRTKSPRQTIATELIRPSSESSARAVRAWAALLRDAATGVPIAVLTIAYSSTAN